MAPETEVETTETEPFDEESLIPDERPTGEGSPDGPVAPAKAAAKPGKAAVEPVEDGEEEGEALDPEVAQLVVEAGLRPVQGETTDQALRRLNKHWSGRATRHYEELRTIRTTQQAADARVAAMEQMVRPILQAEYQRMQQAEAERQMAQIPEPGTPEHQEFLLHQVLARDAQREQRQEQERILAQQQWQQEQQSAQVLAGDEAALDELSEALDADEEAATAYGIVTNLGLRAAERMFPDSTPEQRSEFVRLGQLLDLRMARSRGQDLAEYLKSAASDIRELAGYTNGNGHTAPQAAQDAAAAVSQPAPRAKPKTQGSPTATRLAAQHAQAAARQVVSPTGRGGAPSGEDIDIAGLSEDEYVELRLNGTIDDAMQARRFSRPRSA